MGMKVGVTVAKRAELFAESSSSMEYTSAPGSPREAAEWAGRFYTSAPTSPSRTAAILREFNAAMASPRSPSRSSVIPFDDFSGASADSHPPSVSEDGANQEDDDFAFDFSGQLENGGSSPLTADELFDHGVIRPLKLPPRLQYIPPPPISGDRSPGMSPKSPISTAASRFRRSPRRQSAPEFDPFAAAIEETTRGREREPGEKVKRRAARSLSPLRRVFDFHGKAAAPPVSPSKAAAPPKGGSVKWRLKDLLLFRSASEGRATGGGADKDPVRKYTALSSTSAAMLSRKNSTEEARNSSFRSTDGGSVGGSARRSVPSAHERHYAANRAAAEEMRRKTMLPYRQSLFGFLNFNPAINGLTKGFSTFRSRHD